MVGYTRELKRLLKGAGCSVVRPGKGDHEIWYSPHTDTNFPVDGGIRSRHAANKTLADAGLPERFRSPRHRRPLPEGERLGQGALPMEDRTLNMNARARPGRIGWRRAAAAGAALALVSLLFLLKPGIDLRVSGFFWTAELGFAWRSDPVAEFLHDLVQVGARIMAVVFLLAALWTAFRRTALFGWGTRAWAFLLLALLVGPGLMTNTVLKDNWGRARPWQVEEFGGKNDFSPALLIADACEKNCSFVSGDAALAFYLHSFAYVVAARRSRRVLALGLAAGAAAGLLRIGMGAHFLSDVVFAAVTVMASSALLHALMFGRARTGALWSHWTSRSAHPGAPTGGD